MQQIVEIHERHAGCIRGARREKRIVDASHRCIARRNHPSKRDDESERELSAADAARAGGIHHEDAADRGRGDVDVVDAGPRTRAAASRKMSAASEGSASAITMCMTI